MQARFRLWVSAWFAAPFMLCSPAPAGAAVAVLHAGPARELVLIDAEQLDVALLSRLSAAGFEAEGNTGADCEVVDAGLLNMRIQQARRVVALLSAANLQQLRGTLQALGARLLLDRPAAQMGANAPLELQVLGTVLGGASPGLQAVAAEVGD